MCGLASSFGDMQAKMSGGGRSEYSDPMSDGLLRQIGHHRRIRSRLEQLSRLSLVILAEFFTPQSYSLQLRNAYYSDPYQLVGIAQYTDTAQINAIPEDITPKRYIERVITMGKAAERETIIDEARILLFSALNEYKDIV